MAGILDTLQFVLNVAEMALEFRQYRYRRRCVVEEEARILLEQHGTSAHDVAQQVARLARQRRDRKSRVFWHAVSREIARRSALSP
ncbi:hypothetical protein [Bosea sp. BK604]|uniref:hypothetical protein n=1 Tax=Bosea sp. BK604 TaxID=2512180 RepID=UPI00104B1A04|nr:hypothetical protein [Bosea sp. BK604]